MNHKITMAIESFFWYNLEPIVYNWFFCIVLVELVKINQPRFSENIFSFVDSFLFFTPRMSEFIWIPRVSSSIWQVSELIFKIRGYSYFWNLKVVTYNIIFWKYNLFHLFLIKDLFINYNEKAVKQPLELGVVLT